MSSEDEPTFERADAGAALVYPMQAGEVRKGGHCMLKGKPCKVVEVTTSKTGKHGHAKANITGLDIFTGKKCEDICPSSHNMEIPFVAKSEYPLLDITEDGALSLLTESGETKDDLNLPNIVNIGEPTDHDNEISEKLRAAFDEGKGLNVIVLAAMGLEKVVDLKLEQ